MTAKEIIEQWEYLLSTEIPDGPWAAKLDDCYSNVTSADDDSGIFTSDFETGVCMDPELATYIAAVNPENLKIIIAAFKRLKDG